MTDALRTLALAGLAGAMASFTLMLAAPFLPVVTVRAAFVATCLCGIVANTAYDKAVREPRRDPNG